MILTRQNNFGDRLIVIDVDTELLFTALFSEPSVPLDIQICLFKFSYRSYYCT